MLKRYTYQVNGFEPVSITTSSLMEAISLISGQAGDMDNDVAVSYMGILVAYRENGVWKNPLELAFSKRLE